MAISTSMALVQAVPGSSVAVAGDVAVIIIAGAALLMAILASLVFVRANRILGALHDSATRSFGPVSDRAKIISGNVEFITQALRTDVDRLNGSVRALTDRLNLASERMEERIEEFNALMEVVQGEAEEIFLDTASTVRGVREGARAITTHSVTPEEAEGDAGALPDVDPVIVGED